MLHLVINESATSSKNATSMRFARAMAIRPNTNGLLDLDRAAFCENVDDLERHTKVFYIFVYNKITSEKNNNQLFNGELDGTGAIYIKIITQKVLISISKRSILCKHRVEPMICCTLHSTL